MSKFKVGDKVRILDGSKIDDYVGLWTGGMKNYIGKVCTIRTAEVGKLTGYRMKETNGYIWDERGLELAEDKPKHKFKVGDVVVPKKDNCYGISDKNWTGVVTNVNGNYFDVKSSCGTGKLFEYKDLKSDNFDIIIEQKIVITHNGKTTTAKLYNGKQVVKTATARCCPSDDFDFNIGASIAIERLTGQILGKVENTLFDWDGFKAGNFNVIVNCDSIDRFLEECEAYEINWSLRKATEFNPIKDFYKESSFVRALLQGIMDFDSTNECELEVVEGELVYSFKPEIKESTVRYD